MRYPSTLVPGYAPATQWHDASAAANLVTFALLLHLIQDILRGVDVEQDSWPQLGHLPYRLLNPRVLQVNASFGGKYFLVGPLCLLGCYVQPCFTGLVPIFSLPPAPSATRVSRQQYEHNHHQTQGQKKIIRTIGNRSIEACRSLGMSERYRDMATGNCGLETKAVDRNGASGDPASARAEAHRTQ